MPGGILAAIHAAGKAGVALGKTPELVDFCPFEELADDEKAVALVVGQFVVGKAVRRHGSERQTRAARHYTVLEPRVQCHSVPHSLPRRGEALLARRLTKQRVERCAGA